MKYVLQIILIRLARLYIARYKPIIIAVTGSVGKTSTRDAIASVLKVRYSVRTGVGSINTLLGVPLTIISDDLTRYITDGGTLGFWIITLLKGFLGLLTMKKYPQIVVLEYGADRPGDIARLAKLFSPHIAVVTGVGQMPVHVEFFAGPQEVADEKSKILKWLKQSDFAILNFDDLTVLEMKDKTLAQNRTFGFGQGADVWISDFRILEEPTPWGIAFKLKTAGHSIEIELKGVLGRPQAMACAAAGAMAGILGIGLNEITEGLMQYKPPAGRMRILNGIKGSVIIDDTYNSSPLAVHAAIDTLRQTHGRRKVAILGDMLELGKYSIDAHRAVGNTVGSMADVLVCIGEKAKFIADSADNQLLHGNIFTFHTADEAKIKVQELIREGDVVLVKGSQGKRMEKIVKEIMAEPEKAGELLVRQSASWLKK